MEAAIGWGDQLIATGLAKGAAERGKKIAFGDGRRIIWDHHSAPMFKGNPNIAPPGSEGASDNEWISFYKGHRLYNEHDQKNSRWIWSKEFRCKPGEIFFDPAELAWGKAIGSGFVMMEPNTDIRKQVAPNKQWPPVRYDLVARALKTEGYEIVQLAFGRHRIAGAKVIVAPAFRHALAALSQAALYIGPEGGLHHGAAALGVPAVVLFGGFIPPSVTGYDAHTNLTGGAEACGSWKPCKHCEQAMRAITVDEVIQAARMHLNG